MSLNTWSFSQNSTVTHFLVHVLESMFHVAFAKLQ